MDPRNSSSGHHKERIVAKLSSRSTSVMTVASESSCKIEIDVVTDGQSSKELQVAQRAGDCTK
jgi:hypothetical protein